MKLFAFSFLHKVMVDKSIIKRFHLSERKNIDGKKNCILVRSTEPERPCTGEFQAFENSEHIHDPHQKLLPKSQEVVTPRGPLQNSGTLTASLSKISETSPVYEFSVQSVSTNNNDRRISESQTYEALENQVLYADMPSVKSAPWKSDDKSLLPSPEQFVPGAIQSDGSIEKNEDCNSGSLPLAKIVLDFSDYQFPSKPSQVEVVDRATSPINNLNPAPPSLWSQVQSLIQSSIEGHRHWQTHIDNDTFYMLMLSRGINKVVQRSIVVKNDGEVLVLVHGKTIPTNHPFWEKTSFSLPSPTTVTPTKLSSLILSIYKALRDWRTCIGVPDESLWVEHPKCFMEEGFQDVRYEKTLRASDCLYLVHYNCHRCVKCCAVACGLRYKTKRKDNNLDLLVNAKRANTTVEGNTVVIIEKSVT